YYSDYTIEIRNARIRWAKVGIRNDRNSWQTSTLSVRDTLFEYITGTGSAGIISDPYHIYYTNLKECTVSNPGFPMSHDCGVLFTVRVNDPALDSNSDNPTGAPGKNSQSECSFVVDSTKIVAAFFDTHQSVFGLGQHNFSG